jgi:hypothetical protein
VEMDHAISALTGSHVNFYLVDKHGSIIKDGCTLQFCFSAPQTGEDGGKPVLSRGQGQL